MARVGSFGGPTVHYGVPPSVIAPSDNNIIPSSSQATADQLASNAAALYADLQNSLRDPNAGKAKIIAPKK